MNIMKEQMLKWLDRHGWTAESIPIVDAIRALIESSGDKASGPIPMTKEVGEAMKWLDSLSDMNYPYCRIADENEEIIAVIKAALRPKVVSREWVEKYAIEISNKAGAAEDSWPNIDSLDAKEIIMSMLRELGIEVGEKP